MGPPAGPAPQPGSPSPVVTTPGGTPSGIQTTFVAGQPVSGPSAAGQVVSAPVACPTGTLIGGGGVLDFTAGGGSQSSMRFNGSVPLDASGAPLQSSGPMPLVWAADGAAGGQAMTGAETRPYALCATSGAPTSLQVQFASVPGPYSQTNQPIATATATCPSGLLLMGGGGYTRTPVSAGFNPSLHLIGTYPSIGGQAVPVSGVTADGWTTLADAGGGTLTATVTASYAICGSGGGLSGTQVVVGTVPGPSGGLGENRSLTLSCPAGTAVLGGGGLITSTDPNGMQQGIHLRGSYPGDAGSWTAIVIDGGQTAPNSSTSVFAVCST